MYLTPGLDLPFWRAVSKGVETAAKEKGYGFQALDSHNSAQTQLQNAQDAIVRGVAGIVLSPTDSSTAPSVQALAEKAGIPVVIADIGTNGGEYVSYVSSNNYEGAHGVGLALGQDLKKKGLGNRHRGHRRHLPGPQERSGPHQGLSRRPEGGRLHGQESRP